MELRLGKACSFLPLTHAHTQRRAEDMTARSVPHSCNKAENVSGGTQGHKRSKWLCWCAGNTQIACVCVCVYFAMLCMTCHTGRRLNIFATCIFLAYFHHRWPALCSSSNKIHENIWRTHMSCHNFKANAPQAFCFSKKKITNFNQIIEFNFWLCK